MSHGKAPKPPNQGTHAAPNVRPPATSGKPTDQAAITSTPGLSSSRGVHTTPIGGKGTVGKPGAIKRPGPCC